MSDIERLRAEAREANAQPLDGDRPRRGRRGVRRRGGRRGPPKGTTNQRPFDTEPELYLGAETQDVGARICEGFALMGGDE